MCVWRGNRRSIVPEVVHQRLVVQVGSTCNLAELANPRGRRFPARGTCVRGNGRRFPARGTCVRGNISMRIERRWTVDRARGVVSESCRTTRLHLQLSRVGDFIQWKVSSTWYMCPWEHFHAYGGGNWSVGHARGGVSESCRTTRLHLQLSRVGDFIQWKVSSTWYMCPWEHFHAYGGELVGRSCPRWCIRELSYKSAPAAT